METDQEHQLEHFLQGHFHPDVQPLVRRAIKQEVFDAAGFLAMADIFQANHEALDGQLAQQTDTRIDL